jgi:hypothetical protein
MHRLMASDPKAPQLAAVARVLLGFTIGFLIVNTQLDLLNIDFFLPVSYVFVVFILLLLYINHWASKENPVPELIQQHSSNELDGAYRDGRTLFESSSTMQDQYGFEVSTQSSQQTSQTVVQSILSQPIEPNQETVSSALDALSIQKDDITKEQYLEPINATQQSMAYSRRDASPTDSQTGKVVERVIQPQIALPGKEQNDIANIEEIPGLSTKREFVSTGISSIPLPNLDIEEEEEISLPELIIELPEFDTIVTSEPISVEMNLLDLDDLPSIDDIILDDIQSNDNLDLEDIFVDDMNSKKSQDSALDVQLPSLDDLDF